MARRNSSPPITARPTKTKKKSPGRPKNPISKTAIIDIASSLFTEHGYNGTSLEDIARSANLSKPSLLYHFPSKELLYLAVMDFYVMALLKLILDALVGEGDFEERLDALSDVLVDYLGSNTPLARLLLRDAIDNGPFITKQGHALVQHSFDLTFRFLRSGMPPQALNDNEVRHLVLSILSIHLLYFAIPDITAPFLGHSPFVKESVISRKTFVKQQVRLLCQRQLHSNAKKPA